MTFKFALKIRTLISIFILAFSLSSISMAKDTVISPEQMAKKFRGVQPVASPWYYSDYFETSLAAARFSKNLVYLENMIDQGAQLTKVTAEKLNLVDAATGKKPKALTTSEYLCNDNGGKLQVAYLVHHGVVWAPLVAAAREYLLSLSGPLSKEKRQQISQIISTAMLGLNYFNYQVGGTPSKYLTVKVPGMCTDEIPFVGKPLPLNMSAAGGILALEIIEFFKLSGSRLNEVSPNFEKNAKIYIGRQTKTIQYAMNSIAPYLQKDQNSGGYVWKYRPDGRVEDTSHAALIVEFFSKAQAFGAQGAVSAYIAGMKKTFFYMLKDGPTKVPSSLIRNAGTTFGEAKFVQGITRWVDLGTKDCKVIQKVREIVNFQDQNRRQPFLTLRAQYKMFSHSKTCGN